MNTIVNTAADGKFHPPVWYDAGEGGSMVLPTWAFSQQDRDDNWYVQHGQLAAEDAPLMLADDYSQGEHHANMSRDRFNEIYAAWDFDNNWLVQNENPNMIDLSNVEITNRIHSGVDTTGTTPSPNIPQPARIPTPDTPIQPRQPTAPIEPQRWSPQHIQQIQRPDVSVREVGEYDAIQFTASQKVVVQRNVPRARSQQDFHHQYQQLKSAPSS